ncbi:MAG: hypothetical protein R3F60_04625 [bacterium]
MSLVPITTSLLEVAWAVRGAAIVRLVAAVRAMRLMLLMRVMGLSWLRSRWSRTGLDRDGVGWGRNPLAFFRVQVDAASNIRKVQCFQRFG